MPEPNEWESSDLQVDASHVMLRFETRACQRRLESKIEAKFRTINFSVYNLGGSWVKCLREFCESYYILSTES